MWTDFLSALALVFILEGIMPLVNPDGLRKIFLMATQMDSNTLRLLGFASMIFGLIVLYLVR